ncbi:hypothetical protein Egran_06169 [Elaphomyces granulatus]|uniref:Cysteine protease n=1 Tax=Elaphomyces granulatus TaxID=519963 RepID=A0A232LPI2_9EURO|nr:hypothetical protein Egran_06169 [Elaphomyces granulatus]
MLHPPSITGVTPERITVSDMNGINLGRYKRIVQYLWDPEPWNDCEQSHSIWCLGREYVIHDDRAVDDNDQSNLNAAISESHTLARTEQSTSETPLINSGSSLIRKTSLSADHGWPSSFLDDFESRIWLTYRSNFSTIPKSEDPSASSSMTLGFRLRSQLVDSNGFTSDTGWGCMIRSGQSLLANALSIISLGRDWHRGTKVKEESRLLSLFADSPKAPFSIHRFVNYGSSSCGKHPGEWFGPSATARCIQALSSEYMDAGLNVYVTSDNSDVFEDRFKKIACGESDCVQPTLILLGVRLGIDRVTPVYWKSLTDLLKYPQSVGIAGGRPSASHYFVGVQSSSFFYLDPHHTRPALPYRGAESVYTEEELNSCHTRRLRRLHVKDMDPSMLIGFLIQNEDDWIDWKQRVSSPENRIIHIYNGGPEFESRHERQEALDEVEALDDSSCSE